MDAYRIKAASARTNIIDLKGCGFLQSVGDVDEEPFLSELAAVWLDNEDDDLAIGILHSNVRLIGEILYELRSVMRTREQLRGIANHKYGFKWQTRGQIGDRLCWLRSAGYVWAPHREERRITKAGLDFLERIDLYVPS